MKKQGILNSKISTVLSNMGHTDAIVIADCGLPIPDNVEKIDISLKLGSPSFVEVLDEIIKDMKIESVVLASEIKKENPKIMTETINLLTSQNIKKIEYVSHEELKAKIKNAKAVIRTGENTPYANIILSSGVIF